MQLVTCEVLEMGQISTGIAAEAAQSKTKTANKDDSAAAAASSTDTVSTTEGEASAPGNIERGIVSPFPHKQVTPCDTPSLSRRDGAIRASSSPAAVTPLREKTIGPRLHLPDDYVTINDKGRLKLKPRSLANELEEEANVRQKRPAPAASSSMMEEAKTKKFYAERTKIRKHGFGPSYAPNCWKHEEGGINKLAEPIAKNDQRLEQFVDICLNNHQQSHHGFSPQYNQNNSNGTRELLDNVRWESRFKEMLQFKSIHGHCNVPFRYEHNKPLGGWVQKQRDFWKKGKLAQHRIERLQHAGFSFVLEKKKLPKIKDSNIHSYDDLWDFRYNSLVDYKLSHGHCNVPYRWKKDTQLGRWVQNQREFYKRNTLSSERYSRLMALGFKWSIRKQRGKKHLEERLKAPEVMAPAEDASAAAFGIH